MKFIILDRGNHKIYIEVSKILALEVWYDKDGSEEGTWISIEKFGHGLRVLETPEQIIELINQQEPT